jgi:hypothetical protein
MKFYEIRYFVRFVLLRSAHAVTLLQGIAKRPLREVNEFSTVPTPPSAGSKSAAPQRAVCSHRLNRA